MVIMGPMTWDHYIAVSCCTCLISHCNTLTNGLLCLSGLHSANHARGTTKKGLGS